MYEPGHFVQVPGVVDSSGNPRTTRIFEPSLEHYLKHNHHHGPLGKVDASIDWCETNFAVCYFIAEFWNTLSNIFYVIIALWGLLMVFGRGYERRNALLFFGYFIIGIGSALYHGTLLFQFQILDELPMMIGVLTMVWSCLAMDPAVERKYKKELDYLGKFFTFGFLIYVYLHWKYAFVQVFQTLFGSFTLLSVYLVFREIGKPSTKTEVVGRKMGLTYVISILIAALCWIIDQVFCVELQKLALNPQLHAFWHFFTAVGCLAVGLFLIIRRSWYFGEEPRVEWALGGLMPYVVRGKIVNRKDF
jgi:dihydroceramidase